MSHHGSGVFALAQLTHICHIIVPWCKQRQGECTQIIPTDVGTMSGIPQGRGELGMWTLMRNMKHKALLQAQKVKPTWVPLTSFFPFFFFNMISATKDQSDGNPSAENGAALWGSHWFKSAFPEPWDSLAPCQHRNFMEKSKAGCSKWTGTHK